MQDGFESPLQKPEERDGVILRHPLVIAAATLFCLAAFYLLLFRGPAPSPSAVQTRFPFGAQEQAYAPKLQFGNFEMSRAESFIHQEVTYLAGDVTNSGERTLSGIEATIEFQDDMKQIALKETRPILFGATAALPPGPRGTCNCPRYRLQACNSRPPIGSLYRRTSLMMPECSAPPSWKLRFASSLPRARQNCVRMARVSRHFAEVLRSATRGGAPRFAGVLAARTMRRAASVVSGMARLCCNLSHSRGL